MGAFLDKPKTDKHNEEGSGNKIKFALSSMQGWRVEMEDAHTAIINIPNFPEWSFFAVFDGHAGDLISNKCATMLWETIVSLDDFSKAANASLSEESGRTELENAIKDGFLKLDAKLRELPDMVSGEDKSGSTAVCGLLSPTHVIFANCGDSRAVLSSSKVVKLATEDHKPMNPIERERIQNAGGSVMIQRVNGSLAVSRALGDFEYKTVPDKGPREQLVSPEPEVSFWERSDKDEFVVLACDGIWDVLTNDELCDLVRSRMLITDDLKIICNTVLDTCLSKGSRDNMSMIIIAFKGAPQVSEEEQRREEELNRRIEGKVTEMLKGPVEDTDFIQYVMHNLLSDCLEGLPPGGGIYAKRDIIEETIKRLGYLTSEQSPMDQDN